MDAAAQDLESDHYTGQIFSELFVLTHLTGFRREMVKEHEKYNHCGHE